MALSYPVKRGQVSLRLDRLQTPRKEHPVELNIVHEVAVLQRMSMDQLRQRFAELFGEATAASNRTRLIKCIAWRMQGLAEGDGSERARRRAAELAGDADLRINPPRSKSTTFPPEPVTIPKPIVTIDCRHRVASSPALQGTVTARPGDPGRCLSSPQATTSAKVAPSFVEEAPRRRHVAHQPVQFSELASDRMPGHLSGLPGPAVAGGPRLAFERPGARRMRPGANCSGVLAQPLEPSGVCPRPWRRFNLPATTRRGLGRVDKSQASLAPWVISAAP